MKILITGGAGFIGSHLIEALLNADHFVICVDNFITGLEENIAPFRKNANFELVTKDISKEVPANEKIDYVLSFASPASPVDYMKHPIETLKAGAFGTYNALELALKHKASFLLASTSEVYGDPEVNPQPETYWGNVNSIGPRSVYDEAKRFAEAVAFAYLRKYSLDVKVVRIFNTYGERMRSVDGRAIPNFIDQALKGDELTVYGDGSQTRSFCYVADMIRGILKLMESEGAGPINIGNPVEMTVLALAKKIKEITKSASSIVFKDLPVNDPKQRRPDITKAKNELAWRPEVDLDEGLKRTIEWFKKNNK
ncbi:MAG: SDR family oxidoreductase [Candidatus Omnitrophica bacterium]|nr:SDR family oxidoreductase [Candidatus Omnitrophota bacterium]